VAVCFKITIVIFLDTSILIDSLTGLKHSGPAIRRILDRGERILLPTVTLYEWLRGPRTKEELAVQETMFPIASAVPFGPEEAVLAAHLYRSVRRPRGRDADLAIAACAIRYDAELWTLNVADFKDIPGLRLIR
jgi:predicted nucleic acid-binding protein